MSLSNQARQRITLVTSLVQQFDGLVAEEVALRYSYEVAILRPSTRAVDADNKQYRERLTTKQWELAAAEKTIETLTALPVAALRVEAEALVLLLSRSMEVQQELQNRTLLTPALAAAIADDESPTGVEAKADCAAAMREVPALEKHLAALVQEIETRAGRIGYADLTTVIESKLIH